MSPKENPTNQSRAVLISIEVSTICWILEEKGLLPFYYLGKLLQNPIWIPSPIAIDRSISFPGLCRQSLQTQGQKGNETILLPLTAVPVLDTASYGKPIIIEMFRFVNERYDRPSHYSGLLNVGGLQQIELGSHYLRICQ